VRDAATDTERSVTLERRFDARLDRHYAMDLRAGSFRRENFVEPAARIAATRAFSLELTFRPAQLPADKPGVIAAYSDAADDRRFALMQDGSELVFYLRTEDGPPNGERIPLVPLDGPGPHHLVVSLRKGRLRAFLDGKPVAQRRGLDTRLRDWRPADLIFGSERGGPHLWRGTLEGIALYDRPLDAEEVADNARAYLDEVEGRTEVNTLDVRVRRSAASALPTLEEILPYRDALVVHEYEVLEVLDGDLGEPRIRVAHRALLNGETARAGPDAVGEVLELRLERLEDHPEVQDVYRADDLPVDLDPPVFLDVGP
jgi:hypothetical protein